MNYFLDFIILFVLFVFVNYIYDFILKLSNPDFKYYLKTNKKSGLFHFKIFSYVILVYFLYKDNIIDFDYFFTTSTKINQILNLPVFNKIIYTIILLYICRTMIFLLNSFNEFQKTSFKKPNTLINNYTKVFNFMIIVTGVIFFISIWMEVRVISLIAGLSTASAVFALIFRDFILGVITSITSANSNIARIGDYISLEKYEIKGVIIDISITTVKLKADDENIISFPSYWLINDIMKNRWRTKEEHIKHLDLEFYLKLKKLPELDMYMLEELIMTHENFYKERNIIISYNNEKYNFGTLKLSFFIKLKDYKEMEETKIHIYNLLVNYFLQKNILI
jgi:small-conductance mechanosensitive channel